MKKICTTLLTAVLLASLTGCSNGSSDNDSTPSDTSSSVSEPVSGDSSSESSNSESNSSDTSAPVISEITAQFEVPNGEPADLTKGKWTKATCDGVYLAEAVGVYYDNIANADIFDEKEMKFTGAPETVVHEYKKYNVGDMFGDLKLTEASTEFYAGGSDQKPRKYFNGGSARFEGMLTLTGKCRLENEDKAYIIPQNIEFLPDAKSAKLLPIMRYTFDDEGNEDLMAGVLGDLCYLAENYDLILGNADNYPELDFTGFPEDGSCVDVQVTVDNIYCSRYIEWNRYFFSCDIIDLEIIQ